MDPAETRTAIPMLKTGMTCGVIAALIGVLVLVGWGIDNEPLRRFEEIWRMTPITSTTFLLSGLCLTSMHYARTGSTVAARLARILALVIIVISALRILKLSFGWPLISDELMFIAHFPPSVPIPARLGVVTASALSALAIAMYLALSGRALVLMQALVIFAATVGFLGLGRFAFGGSSFVRFTNMSLLTGPGLIALCVGVVCSHPERGLVALLRSDSPGGLLARRLMLPAILLPIGLRWLTLLAEGQNWYDTDAGESVFAAGMAVAFAVVIWIATTLIHRHDVSRREAEQALRTHARRLAEIIENEPECVTLVDMSGQIVEKNLAGLEMLEVGSLEEARRQPLEDYVHPEDRRAFRSMLERVARGESTKLEYRLIGARGGQRWLQTSAVPLRDESEKLYGVLGISRDVSAQKQAEAAQSKVNLFRNLLDFTSDLIYIADVDTRRILDCNAALPRLLGYTRQEMQQMTVEQLSAAAIPMSQWLRDIELLRSGRPLIFEKDYRTKDGTAIPVEINLRYAEQEGRPLLVAVIRDVTERRRADEALREKQEMLQEYASQLQAASRRALEVQETERRVTARELHDSVGQQLTALSLNLTLLRAAVPKSAADAVAQRINDSQALIEETSQSLRHVMMELRPPGLDELGLLAALRHHAARVASRSNLKFHVSGSEPVPRLEPDEAIALFRIAQEALNNIVKHAQANEFSIELTHEGESVRLTVSDNGKGLAGLQTRRAPHGMGMLTMRERAEAIGAQLTVASQASQGTRITVDLPHRKQTSESRQTAT